MKLFNNFGEFISNVRGLLDNNKYNEAIDILECELNENFDSEIEQYYVIMFLGYAYGAVGSYEKSIDMFDYGLKKKYFFKLDKMDIVDRIKKFDLESFEKLIEEDKRLFHEAQERSKPEYNVVLPDNYNKNKKYPLFISLHGRNSNLNEMKRHWISKRLKDEFISLYIQSSQVAPFKDSYVWDNFDFSTSEIKSIYFNIIEQYPIDNKNIIISGFSQGGGLSMSLVLNNVIQAKGFFALCPTNPKDLNNNALIDANNRKVKGVISSGETDYLKSQQLEIIKLFDKANFTYKHFVNKGIGHDFPDNLNQLIDDSVSFLID